MQDQISSLPAPAIEWRRAFIRSGFYFRDEAGTFSFVHENLQTEPFFRMVLVELNEIGNYKGRVFSPSSPTVDEDAWLDAIERLHSGAEGGASGMRTIELQIMDTYMAGIIRWVNAAGIETSYSCDGHKLREPRMTLSDKRQDPLLDYFLGAVSDGNWRFQNCRLFKRSTTPIRRTVSYTDYDRSWLLDVAEKCYQYQAELRQFVEDGRKLATATFEQR